MKPVPKFITVLGHKVAVRALPVKLRADREGDYHSSPNPTIRIDRTMSADRQRATLLHEALHAVLDLCGHNALFSSAHEEVLVRAIESGIGPLVRFRFDDE